MTVKRFLIGLFLLSTVWAYGQESQQRIQVKHISETIVIDGQLNENEWSLVASGSDFWQFFPTDSALSVNHTEFKLLYDDHYLYIGIRAEVKSENYVVTSLRRDFGGASNDNVTLMFDTFNDGTTAFLFGMTPYGVQREVFVSGGGADFNTTWDQKWQLESHMESDHYILEAAIPFASLKYKEGSTSWRMKCYRWDMQTNEQSTWVRVPQNQLLSSLAFMGEMVFEKPLGKSHTPVAIIPYINALADKDFVLDESDTWLKVGGDAKVSVGNAMNLDITVNPDFSNVEVDDIFTNLTRFEVFLPEKRQFFIDNNDLFGNYGDMYNAAKPFFSRRIGLARDTMGNLIENHILGGVRLSGKLGEDWRLGFLNLQTAEDPDNHIASNNNMMFSLQKKMFSRSNLGLFAINRQTIGDYDFVTDNEAYNRVIGMDYNLASKDNSWTGKFYLHKSFQPDDSKGNLSAQATVTLMKRKFRWIADLMYVDQDFRSDLGFIPRTGIFKSGNGFSYNFYPSKGKISQHSPGVMLLFYWQSELDYKKTDHVYRLYYDIMFKNQSTLEFSYDNNFVYLSNGFDPTWSGGIPLPGDKEYSYNQASLTYVSNPAKVVSYNASATAGEFYIGNNLSATGGFTVRMQPWALFSLNMRYDRIRLPNPHADADYLLVTPRVDVTFSKSLFWSTLVQYSKQRDNLGINSRLQWRFAPLSDLYLVYNDNYFTGDFGPRFRSINLKITYWLNI